MKDDVKFLIPDMRSWLLWEPDDPAWSWFNAIGRADAFADPKDFIELIAEHAPPHVMPFIADFLHRRLKLDKQQPKHPRWLWLPNKVLTIAGRYVYSLKELCGYSLGDAVDEVFVVIPGFGKFFDRNTLYDHCNEQTSLGKLEKKRMKKIITKVRPY